MKRSSLLLAIGALFLAACGPAEVVVTAELDSDDGPRPISDLEVQLLPFDRDQLFDSLEAAFAQPEPAIPPEILEAQQQIADAQRAWRELQDEQAQLRQELSDVSDEMAGLSETSPRYRVLYGEFNEIQSRLDGVDRRVQTAFDTFTSLQQGNIAQQDSIRILRESWAMEAFADYDQAFIDAIEASGLDLATDTTDANGVATLSVKPGQYWVFARFEQPYSELYWNNPIDVTGGEPFTITLNPANAVERPIL